MVVCLCRNLSDHAIRARLHAGGLGAARGLIEACGAGGDCGSCAWMLDALLDGHEYSGSITTSRTSPGETRTSPREPLCAAMTKSSAC